MTAEVRRSFRFYLYPLLVVGVVGAFLFALELAPPFGRQELSPPKVTLGRDYYVTVSLVELSPSDGDSLWDPVDESGPDIFVEAYWMGNRIYRSTTKEDTFVAKWSNAELSLRDLALKGSNTSMDDLIRAARVNIRKDETIEIKVLESDLLTSSVAGTFTLTTSELFVGDHTYESPSGGVRRLTVRVLDMQNAVDPLG